MTGFGRGEAESWITEIRTVNHRFGDVLCRLPRNLSPLESRFKEEIKKKINRGRIEVYCSSDDSKSSKTSTLVLDEPMADQLIKLLHHLSERYDINQKVDLSLLASFKEIFKMEEESQDLDQVWESILPSLNGAIESLDQMRQLEGNNLFVGLKDSLQAIEKNKNKIFDQAPQVVISYHERLVKRLDKLLPGDSLDEGRLLQEVALFSDRCDINEEITRLDSHIQQFYSGMDGPGPHGKRLEFLLQEMNREINTIGSKGNEIHISQWVVECKCELEKMREQIQNIE